MKRRPDDKPQPSAYGKALGWLARREHSARELERKLGRSGFDRDESRAALERLQSKQFQDDARFADTLIRTRIGQGYGPRRIRAELRGHGLSETDIRERLDAEAPDWASLAASQCRRRFGDRAATDPAERQRRTAFLLRRGFDAATVRAITHADDVDDSSDDFD